jgi:hypothetical protein
MLSLESGSSLSPELPLLLLLFYAIIVHLFSHFPKLLYRSRIPCVWPHGLHSSLQVYLKLLQRLSRIPGSKTNSQNSPSSWRFALPQATFSVLSQAYSKLEFTRGERPHAFCEHSYRPEWTWLLKSPPIYSWFYTLYYSKATMGSLACTVFEQCPQLF